MAATKLMEGAEGTGEPVTPEDHAFLQALTLKKTIWIGKPTAKFETHYKKGKRLGDAGQYGTTYQCTRISDGEKFAVKELPKNRFHRIPPKNRLRYLSVMQTEIDILMTLGAHPNIVKLWKVYEDKPTLRLVMEECTGGELFARIIARERYSEEDGAYVLKQLFSALQFMHEKHEIVHCDLKPDNILFATPDDKSPVKIIDFGMSKVLPRLKYLTHLCGTPYYTAPEIIQPVKKERRYNHAVDMWAMGVIMYVMIFGYPPFYVDPERYTGKRERQAIYRKILKGFRPQVIETKKYGYGPWFPSHIPVSEWCRDLLTNLLKTDVAPRYNASEALQHPWIVFNGAVPESYSSLGKYRTVSLDTVEYYAAASSSSSSSSSSISASETGAVASSSAGAGTTVAAVSGDEKSDDTGSSTAASAGAATSSASVASTEKRKKKIRKPKEVPLPKKKHIIASIAKFSKGCQIRQVVIKLFAKEYETMRPHHFADLERLFLEFDTDGDGVISYSEFQAALSKLDGLSLTDAQIADIFAELDLSEMGGLKFEDLLSAVVHDYLVACDERLYRAFCDLDENSDGYITPDELMSKLKEVDPLGEWERAMEIIDKQKLNKDGEICYEEFLLALHPNFEETPEWVPDLYNMKSTKVAAATGDS